VDAARNAFHSPELTALASSAAGDKSGVGGEPTSKGIRFDNGGRDLMIKRQGFMQAQIPHYRSHDQAQQPIKNDEN
jgi:hypothetical protein